MCNLQEVNYDLSTQPRLQTVSISFPFLGFSRLFDVKVKLQQMISQEVEAACFKVAVYFLCAHTVNDPADRQDIRGSRESKE